MVVIDTNKPSNEDQGKRQQMWLKVKEFLETTTAHGCSRLVASTGIFWKVFWIILFLAAHGTFLYQTTVIIQEYIQRPIRTKISVEHAKKLDFPMVTICNLNLIRNSQLDPSLQSEIKKTFSLLDQKPKSTTNSTDDFEAALPDFNDLHSSRARLDALRKIFSKIPMDELVRKGHQIKDMVVDCSYNSRDCTSFENKDIWREIWLDQVGNCFMFNPTWLKETEDSKVERASLQSTMSGDQHGLTLMLNIQQDEYLRDASPYAGLKVVIGKQRVMPFPLNQGINVAPGFATGIEIRKNHILRMDPFHNNTCRKNKELDPDNLYAEFDMGYSKMACRSSCLFKMQSKTCHCSVYDGDNDYSFCDFGNKTIVKCFNRVYETFLNGSCEKECPPPCSEEFFTTTISSSNWPANHYKKTLMSNMMEDYGINMTAQQVNDNLVELRVYYAELDYVQIEETLKYGFADLMCNVGGQMGVWIGLSALTIGEVFQMICMLIRCLFNKNSKNNNVVNVNY